MAFLKTSRKDDFISLFYMLIFMLNDRKLWVGDQDPCKGVDGIQKIFGSICNWKYNHDLCTIAMLFCKDFEFPLKNQHHDNKKHIRKFYLNISLLADEIQKIKFAEKPAYSKIRSHLIECKKACQMLGKIWHIS